MGAAPEMASRIAPGHGWRARARRGWLGPAYLTVAVRWGAWLMALVIILTHGPPRYDLATALPFLALTAALNVLFTVWFPLLRGRLGALRHSALSGALDGRLLFAAVDFLLAQAALAATGGFHSAFLVYSLTTLMFPAIVFGWRAGLLAAT